MNGARDILMKKRMAIIVPYRDRYDHLKKFVPKLMEYLDQYKYSYRIYIINQANNKLFNRATLFNIGFDILKDNFDYFCFHDVDAIPVPDKDRIDKQCFSKSPMTDYIYPKYPTHIATFLEQWGYKINGSNKQGMECGKQTLERSQQFGGICMFNKKDFIDVNGFSNLYEGWGAEDNDLYFRCKIKEKSIERRPGMYYALQHHGKERSEGKGVNTKSMNPMYRKNVDRVLEFREACTKNQKEAIRMLENDGLNQLNKTFKYKVLSTKVLDFDGHKCRIYNVDFSCSCKKSKVSIVFPVTDLSLLTQTISSIESTLYPKDLIEIIIFTDLDISDVIYEHNIHIKHIKPLNNSSMSYNKCLSVATGNIIIIQDEGVLYAGDIINHCILNIKDNVMMYPSYKYDGAIPNKSITAKKIGYDNLGDKKAFGVMCVKKIFIDMVEGFNEKYDMNRFDLINRIGINVFNIEPTQILMNTSPPIALCVKDILYEEDIKLELNKNTLYKKFDYLL